MKHTVKLTADLIVDGDFTQSELFNLLYAFDNNTIEHNGLKGKLVLKTAATQQIMNT